MGSLIIVLTAFAVYCSEVYCDTLPTKIAKPEDTVLVERNNSSQNATIEKESVWKVLSLSKRKPKMEETRSLDGTNGETDRRKGRFLNSLAFLTGLSFGGLANAASSTMKNIAKIPQVLSINLGSSKTSPYFTAYYSQYPALIPYPFFYPGLIGLDGAKPQTSQSADLTPQLINLFDNKPIDLENNEDYSDAGNGADDRIRLQDRNAEEKGTIRGCKEGQRKSSNVKGTNRERDYFNTVNLRQTSNFQGTNQTTTTTTTIRPNITTTIRPDNTTHHHHHHHHHHHGHKEYGHKEYGHKEHNHFPGYYGGYPQNIQHVEFTTQPYSPISYNAPQTNS
ncbi:PREDICTED: probable serine/threonine-protein kinase fhkB isoform X2 [Wasmannia auropunctata]|uniref:probable serine/threonine-protein kinase fhkB isoform X2 n=1 Tax=Wasmannia auropunctata TaxID=64793 RepID=UPI0005EFD72E|nr:PREDICTED: probable serine/threonine-protein kinase fhkB isoform X2 [Wasmannia auropunctata]